MKDRPNDWLDILNEPLPIADAIAHVSQAPEAGGTCVFIGTTRDERNAAGQALVALDYEAYVEMASGQLAELAAEARRRWPDLRRVALLHRIGRVALAEPSVIVAVATPHRAEAFDACRWLIDTLKASVAIWKKEIWADGAATWVTPR